MSEANKIWQWVFIILIIVPKITFSSPLPKNSGLKFDECKRAYVQFIRGGPDKRDCLDSLDAYSLEKLLEQATLELSFLNVESIYWFCKTNRNGFLYKGKIRKIFLSTKDTCVSSLWKALYLYKNESIPRKKAMGRCEVVDTLITRALEVDSAALDLIYTTYSDKHGY